MAKLGFAPQANQLAVDVGPVGGQVLEKDVKGGAATTSRPAVVATAAAEQRTADRRPKGGVGLVFVAVWAAKAVSVLAFAVIVIVVVVEAVKDAMLLGEGHGGGKGHVGVGAAKGDPVLMMRANVEGGYGEWERIRSRGSILLNAATVMATRRGQSQMRVQNVPG